MNFLVIQNLVLLFDSIYTTVMILILFIPLFKDHEKDVLRLMYIYLQLIVHQ